MKRILISNSVFFNQVAILQDDRLVDYLYEEIDKKGLLGNIYKGKVMNILPGMEAAFLDIGLDKNAYLFLNDLLSDKFLKEKGIKRKEATISKVLKKGDELLVQVIREPIGEKYVSLTTDISLMGKYLAFIPKTIDVNISKKIRKVEERTRLETIGKSIMKKGNGMIIRTFAQGSSYDSIEKEYKILSSLYKGIEQEYAYSYAPKLLYKSNSLIERLFLDYIDPSVDEIYFEDKESKEKLRDMIAEYDVEELKNIKLVQSQRVFDSFNIESKVNSLFHRKVELDGGGTIVIDVTEALTVIDVNSGKFVGSKNMEETALEINLLALEEIVRQVKLRNLSGIILIDFIDVKKKENINKIISRARSLFKDSGALTNVVGMTKLNLLELTRKKDKDNFFNLITDECEYCKGSGRSSSKTYILIKIENIVKNIKLNTSSEAVILRVGSIIYDKIMNECMDIVCQIEKTYHMQIIFEEDSSLRDDIVIEKMGKSAYIKDIIRKK